MQHAFAVTLEAEMSRLDHARVYRADGHLVDFVPFDAEKIGHGGLDRRMIATAPYVVPGAVGMVKADRLQPRVSDRSDTPLLGDFALEPMGLRTVGQ